MTDLLTIGATATQLYRQALSTVSNNIANINSEGYSRQEVTTAENAPSQQGVSYIGTGARLQGIQRAYDEFAESSIRTAQSSLAAQEPMIKYTDRVINLMGSETGGLSAAIDKFFSSATKLSTNPSEQTYRQEFLSSANFFAARVQSISTDLSALDNEMRSEVKANIDELNQLATSLSLVNRQLGKNTKQSLQPPAILDQRDHLMHEMSKLAKLDFTFDIAGRVDVKLAGASDSTTFVKTNEAKTLSAVFPTTPGSPVAILFDPYGEKLNVGALKGGTIGGLLSFRDDVFEPLRDDLDSLVESLTTSLNTVHAAGMNQNNETGQVLFSLATTYLGSNADGTLDAGVKATALSSSADIAGGFSAQWSAATKTWLVTDSASGVSTSVQPSSSDGKSFEYAGLAIETADAPVNGRQFFVSPSLRASENISVAINDSKQIASAGRLLLQQSVNNTKLISAEIEYGQAQPLSFAASTIDGGSKVNFLSSATVTTNSVEPALRIPKGSAGFSVTIQPDLAESQALQVFTTQLNHIAGTTLTDEFRTGLASATPIESNASYLSAYANETGTAAYLDSALKIGASAKDSLLSLPIPKQSNTTGLSSTLIGNQAITLNGVALGPLTLDTGTTLSAQQIASWANAASASTDVTASARNSLVISPDDFDTTRRLSINGTTIVDLTRPDNTRALADLINAQAATTRVGASIDAQGNLVLANTEGNEGENFVLGSPDGGEASNFLGRANAIVIGRVYYEAADDGGAIDFGFGNYWTGEGTPQDLARLGLATTISSDKEVSEDLLIYATGDSAKTDIEFRVGAPVAKQGNEVEEALEFKFTAEKTVEIRDTATNTLLATRTYESAKELVFGDIRLRFSDTPSVGDVFTVKPNFDGLGDNTTISALANVQNTRLEGGEIPVQAYITLVNGVGNVNSLSKMSAEALEVVYDDAVAIGDAASGVSLDDEAANLIRFQQSYQAAAQIIKISGDLFDAILSASR